jgi:hypothetical protein
VAGVSPASIGNESLVCHQRVFSERPESDCAPPASLGEDDRVTELRVVQLQVQLTGGWCVTSQLANNHENLASDQGPEAE